MRGRYYVFLFFFFNRDFAQRKKCSLHVKTDEDLHIERKRSQIMQRRCAVCNVQSKNLRLFSNPGFALKMFLLGGVLRKYP